MYKFRPYILTRQVFTSICTFASKDSVMATYFLFYLAPGIAVHTRPLVVVLKFIRLHNLSEEFFQACDNSSQAFFCDGAGACQIYADKIVIPIHASSIDSYSVVVQKILFNLL